MSDAPRPTYRDCLEAGLSTTQTARARGVSKQAVSAWAQRNGVQFARDYSDNAERLRNLHKDPEFRKAHAERMREMHKDPEFKEANAERMRKMNKDPEFRKANAERMREMHKDPEFNPLAALTEEQRADYDVLKKSGYTREEAFAALGVQP